MRRLAGWVRERIPVWRMVYGAEGTEQWRNWANIKEGKSQAAEAQQAKQEAKWVRSTQRGASER